MVQQLTRLSSKGKVHQQGAQARRERAMQSVEIIRLENS
jgi:hypothetical protein